MDDLFFLHFFKIYTPFFSYQDPSTYFINSVNFLGNPPLPPLILVPAPQFFLNLR